MNIINEKVSAYIDQHYVPVNQKLSRLREKAEENGVPIILRDTEELLLSLMRMKKPERMLEIGTAVGYSASCFAFCAAEYSRDFRFVTLEANPVVYQEAVNNIKSLGLEEQIEIIPGDARESLKHLTGIFDMVFIDAAKGQYRVFWDGVLPYCKPGTVIICDNILMKAATASDEYDPTGRFKTSIRKMREFLNYIKSYPNGDTAILPVGDGVSISVLK